MSADATHVRAPRVDPRAVCQVLREDPDLAEAVAPGLRPRAVEECIARTVLLPRGAWRTPEPQFMRDGIGLLVMDGLLIRRVGVDGRFGAELLGEGDLLRPWQGEDAQPTLPRTSAWRVLEAARLAVLDNRAAARLSRYPELTGRLVGRALERSRNLAVNMAIVHHPRVEVRLLMLLWHLADRWGRVGPDGITLPLGLTHAVLAELVAAQRPTVTVCLARLARQQHVRPVDQGWLLSGQAPFELLELRSAPDPGQPATGGAALGRGSG